MEKTMDMDVQKIKNQIDILSNHLQALRDLVSEKLPDLPQRAIARIAKNECLSCGHPLEETPPVKIVRGNHERCYRKITRSIQKGLTTENAAITAGMLTHVIRKIPSFRRINDEELSRLNDYLKLKGAVDK